MSSRPTPVITVHPSKSYEEVRIAARHNPQDNALNTALEAYNLYNMLVREYEIMSAESTFVNRFGKRYTLKRLREKWDDAVKDFEDRQRICDNLTAHYRMPTRAAISSREKARSEMDRLQTIVRVWQSIWPHANENDFQPTQQEQYNLLDSLKTNIERQCYYLNTLLDEVSTSIRYSIGRSNYKPISRHAHALV